MTTFARAQATYAETLAHRRAQLARRTRCPLCECFLLLRQCEHRDAYEARCRCIGLAEGSLRFSIFIIDADHLGQRIPLGRYLAGHHLRWLCAAMRERAQEYQLG